MQKPLRPLVLVGLIACAAWTSLTVPAAQMRVQPLDMAQGHVALGLALRHLANTGIFLHATAHPDDENNGLLVMLNRGQGVRTALATATRGNGGQNEIGPEIFEALGVLRTEELAALHRFDGAEQYFTRAVDFGFSFSVEETFKLWGRDEIIGDFVRLIRMIRPDVIVGMSPDGTGGGQHHQASALLSREAFRLAADPASYPEQVAAGLRPWQPKKYYFSAGFGRGGDTRPGVSVDLAVYDSLLGRTYAEIGTEARSMHKCQGMAQLLSLPGPSSSRFFLVESALPPAAAAERGLFDGIDTTLPGLAAHAGPTPPRELVDGLSSIAASVAAAARSFESEGDAATLAPLLAGLRQTRALRGRLGTLGLTDAARFEIDVRLQQKEREFQDAALLAHAVRVDVLADDGIVAPGQPVRVALTVANRGPRDVGLRQVRVDGFEGGAACTMAPVTAADFGMRGRTAPPPPSPPARAMTAIARDQVGRCEVPLTVPAAARVTEPYWHRAGDSGRYTFDTDAPFGLPYRPTPFTAALTFGLDDGSGAVEVSATLPVHYRYEGNIFSGEKRSELFVVPALSVQASPDILIVPAGAAASSQPAGSEREVRVTIVNGARGRSEGTVTLSVPQGWRTTPERVPVSFSREDEAQTVRFLVGAPAGVAPGAYEIRAAVASGAQSFTRGYQVIEYPHIRRQHIYQDAATRLKLVDVRTAPGLTVGYIMGVGDGVPAAIAQLGATVELIDAERLAFGSLQRYDVIITGVRAYEARADLRAHNERLLQYVRDGGTVIVQYNKFEFNQAQYGPYPAKVSNNRVTDEGAPVMLLDPAHPVFSTPNRINEATWRGWVQERGLYFLGERAPEYRDLVGLSDPFPYNAGEKRGALVEATYGKGRWLYVGLGLWRELPAGVEGAYQLMANLISLGKSGAAPANP